MHVYLHVRTYMHVSFVSQLRLTPHSQAPCLCLCIIHVHVVQGAIFRAWSVLVWGWEVMLSTCMFLCVVFDTLYKKWFMLCHHKKKQWLKLLSVLHVHVHVLRSNFYPPLFLQSWWFPEVMATIHYPIPPDSHCCCPGYHHPTCYINLQDCIYRTVDTCTCTCMFICVQLYMS